MQVGHGEYCQMYDRLPSNGVCSGSCDLCKFWQISDNISEMVQDTEMV